MFLKSWTLAAAIASTFAVPQTSPVTDPFDSAEAIDRLLRGELECTLEKQDKRLIYVGNTGERSFDCFESHRSSDIETLVVVSAGGQVREALAGAAVIEQQGWKIRVIGICASSCANYWLPASRSFTTSPGTALLVHGRPGWMLTSLFGDDDYRKHRRFVRRHAIDDAWFGEKYHDRPHTLSQSLGDHRAPNLLIGPCHTELLNGTITQEVWWPETLVVLKHFVAQVERRWGDVRIKQCEVDRVAIE